MVEENMSVLKEIEPLWSDYCSSEEFEFLNEDDFENTVLPYLRSQTQPCAQRMLDINYKDRYTMNALDEYYISLINDTLKIIRKGEMAYIFNLEQVREILRFEPEAQFTLFGGVYYVNLCK